MRKAITLVVSLMMMATLAAPVRSLVAARNTIGAEFEAKTYTAADYVQDGLIAMWDGIENAGWGVHDESMRCLVDLCGNPDYDMYLNHSSVILGDSYVLIPTNYSVSSIFPISTKTTQSLSTETKTVECFVTSFTGRGSLSVTCLYELGVNNRVDFYYGAAYAIRTGTSSSSRACFQAMPYGTENGSYTFSYQDDISVCTAIYHNGRRIDNTNNRVIPSPGYGGGAMKIGSWNWKGAANAIPKGVKIHSLRVYGRVLSDAEVLHNYRIDKSRFNLP